MAKENIWSGEEEKNIGGKRVKDSGEGKLLRTEGWLDKWTGCIRGARGSKNRLTKQSAIIFRIG